MAENPSVIDESQDHGEDHIVKHCGLDLTFHNVDVNIGDKHILNDVYGAVQSGQVMAIMGPSGGGKTTLLNCLSGRMPVDSGEITLGGSLLCKRLRRKICYVLQQDIFFPNLTLKETLMFTTLLRLPESMSFTEKVNKLDMLIDELDLKKCSNTLMGGMWMPGLSGGEMKRASIACELITDPVIILLDEPTSGLDYRTAFSLIQTLKRYAKCHQKIVVSTLHQPSSQMFLQFDLLLLMCDGHSIYYGPPSDVTQFFNQAGFPMISHYNPADFILEKIKESAATKQRLIETSYVTRKLSFNETLGSENHKIENDGDFGGERNRTWNKSPWNKHVKSPKDKDTDVHVNLMELDEELYTTVTTAEQKWPTGFVTQYKYLTLRACTQAKAHLIDKFKIFETAFLATLLSVIWFQLPRTEDTLRDRMGLIYYMSMHWAFSPLFDAATRFPLEKSVLQKERSSSWYRLSAYYLARLTSDLPLITVQPLLFITAVYWITGLNNVCSYFATLATIFVHALTGQSLGLCIGIFAMDMRKGISQSTIIIMFIMLIGGFYTRNLPFWLDWAKYTAFLYYTFNCLMFLEFYNGENVLCSQMTSTTQSHFAICSHSNSTDISTIPSQEVLHFYGIDQPFWHYFLPLLGFLIFFRVLGYLILRFYQKPQ